MKFPDTSEWYTPERALQEEVQWLLHGRHRKLMDDLLGPLLKGKTVEEVVELGCGSGILAGMLPEGVGYLGVDANAWFIGRAKMRCREKHHYILGDARTLPKIKVYHLAMAWDFLKNFAPEEWSSLLGKLLSLAPLAAFNVQEVDGAGFDVGTEYHQTFVTAADVRLALARGGHEVLSRTVLSEFSARDVPARDVAYFTGRRDGDDTVEAALPLRGEGEGGQQERRVQGVPEEA